MEVEIKLWPAAGRASIGIGQALFDGSLCQVSGAPGEAVGLEGSGAGIRDFLQNALRPRAAIDFCDVVGTLPEPELTSRTR